jgi:ApbE superfamily uncharacterized protein (UPF0280 family)
MMSMHEQIVAFVVVRVIDAQVVATGGDASIAVGWNDALSALANCRVAADALAAKIGWPVEVLGDETINEDGSCLFTFFSQDAI